MIETIHTVIHGEPTTSQLEILMRADRLFTTCGGRYFGGQLTANDIVALTTNVELRASTRDRLDRYALAQLRGAIQAGGPNV